MPKPGTLQNLLSFVDQICWTPPTMTNFSPYHSDQRPERSQVCTDALLRSRDTDTVDIWKCYRRTDQRTDMGNMGKPLEILTHLKTNLPCQKRWRLSGQLLRHHPWPDRDQSATLGGSHHILTLRGMDRRRRRSLQAKAVSQIVSFRNECL